MTIGQKIKELRNKAGLTQSELCRDFITRNMLSRIEHDAALPSLGTLCELCQKLGISAGYLIDDTTDEFPYRKLFLIPRIREYCLAGDYGNALLLCESLSGDDDETILIKCECLYQMGKKMCDSGELFEAKALFSDSEKYALSMTYGSEMFAARAREMLADIEYAANARIPDFPYGASDFTASRAEYYMYLYMLGIAKNARYDLAAGIYDTLKFSNSFYKKHISARLSASAHNHSRAITLLSELADNFENTGENIVLMYGVYSDLEISCRAASDYEKAYACLRKRTELLERIKTPS